LEKRGWTSKINLDKATKILDKIKKAAKKELAEKMSERKRIPHAETISLYNEGSHIRVVLENVNTGILSSNKMTGIAKQVFDFYKIKVGVRFKQCNFSSLAIEVGPIEGIINIEEAAAAFKEELHLYIQNCQSKKRDKELKINLDKTHELRGLRKAHPSGEVRSSASYRRYEKYGYKTTSDKSVKKSAPEVGLPPAYYSRVDETDEESNSEKVLEELPIEEQINTAPPRASHLVRNMRMAQEGSSETFSRGELVSEYKPSYAYSGSAATYAKKDPDSDDVERAR